MLIPEFGRNFIRSSPIARRGIRSTMIFHSIRNDGLREKIRFHPRNLPRRSLVRKPARLAVALCGGGSAVDDLMCRSIKTLHNSSPSATIGVLRADFVRRHPSAPSGGWRLLDFQARYYFCELVGAFVNEPIVFRACAVGDAALLEGRSRGAFGLSDK